MDTITTLLILLFSIGAIQGLVYGIILLISNKQNRLANRLLATLLFLFSYRLIVQTLRLFGLGHYDEWYYVMLDFSWVHGALLYFYIQAWVLPQFKFTLKDSIHLIPLILQIICSVFVRLQNLYWDGSRESLSWLGYWGYVVWMNLPTIHIIASALIILYTTRAHHLLLHLPHTFPIDTHRIAWIRKIILSFRLYFALVLGILLLDVGIYKFILGNEYYYFTRFFYYPFFAGISMLTYWMGIEGFKRKDQVRTAPKKTLAPEKKAQLTQIASQLDQLMKGEKMYQNPELSLQIVADQLQVKPYLLSRALNEILNSKFNDYINQLRVQEVRALLQDPQNAHYTLLSLALQAGFNSKSSFHRAVKKHLNISPRELKSHTAGFNS